MKNQTIIQIGAHIGKTNNDPIFSKVCSESRLILIEPVPFLFKILHDRELDKNFIDKVNANLKVRVISKNDL